MPAKAFICGLAGTVLLPEERAFLKAERPWGVILFGRNIAEAEQIRRLCADIREALDDPSLAILIDQEGGRVQRIREPILRRYPPAATFGEIFACDAEAGLEAARLGAQLIGLDLAGLGINVDCLPLLDIPQAGSSGVIGDRAYGRSPEVVTALGRAAICGLKAAGVAPVIKHLPGHGRSTLDTHLALPEVDAAVEELAAFDFKPFTALASEAELGMTAHIVFSSVDSARPATQSPAVIARIIRERISFDGLLMTDDISMHALSGGFSERSRLALQAGCDLVLHCNGDMAEMRDVACAAPELSGASLARAARAAEAMRPAEAVDRAALEARFEALLAMGTS
ncbi:beta-N-acetylhexosaminidase [Afifella sp. IM 167]|uniref:beta-N-acetylhexosaminidase n=1 Tax=Afifella sp. IM 167 TaxID=2033586 RepID=UPI001CCC7F69|nr:beta-N-acetylhexosaminidase [Afifella sp. IM 167]MBZ8132561.1 beta-N-acetylhexosaminidase [Afifella sp. IM 167]